jgi:hypothetical protein
MTENKVINLPKNTVLCEKTINALDALFNTATPQDIKQSIHEFMFFMLINTDTQWYPDNFNTLMRRMYVLDQFLATAAENCQRDE